MNLFSVATVRRHTLTIALVMAAVALLANLPLILNPGFYSHDEWQRYDFITTHGIIDYVSRQLTIRAGATFAVPVRPIGFIQQGLAAVWMKLAPWVPHLTSALLHAFVAIAVLFTNLIAGIPRRIAVLAALLFCVSPLGMLANGWTGASFDQWYTLFALASLCVTLLIMRHGFRPRYLLALTCFSSAAILSKETAMVLPVALAGGGLFVNLIRNEKIQWRRLIVATAIAALPIAVYLMIRFPALQRSIASTRLTAPYSPSIHNLLPNTLAYFEFPFIPTLGDMVSAVYESSWIKSGALLFQLALIACLAWVGHWKITVAYVFSYAVFLLPILLIPNLSSHYLYASGIAFSTALAWLLATRFNHLKRIAIFFAAACVCVCTIHAFSLQEQIYARGVCQIRFLDSLDMIMPTRAKAGEVTTIAWQSGTPEYVAASTIFGRAAYQGVHFQLAPLNGMTTPDALQMGSDCRVSR